MTAPPKLSRAIDEARGSLLTSLALWIPGVLGGLRIWEEEIPQCGSAGVESRKDLCG